MSEANQPQQTYNITMQPIGRRVAISTKKTLLDATQLAGVDLISICGGIGVCENCKIRIISGKVSPITRIEQEIFSVQQINQGYRLACQAYPGSDVKIDIPPESLTTPQRLQIEGEDEYILPNPTVSAHHIEIYPPSINDLRSDAVRLLDALSQHHNLNDVSFDYSVLTYLSPKLREAQWDILVTIRDNQIISVNNSQQSSLLAGIAVDIGTTKLAAYLVNLDNGETLAKTGTMNPQIAYGEDVISRISYANRPLERDGINSRNILQKIIIQSINLLIDELCTEVKKSFNEFKCENIVDAVVVGNTAMHHLFAGYPVKQLGEAPYVASVGEPTNILARDLGLNICSGAEIHLPSIIAGFVGADHVAMLLATLFNGLNDYAQNNKTKIALDIGTNTEISLLHNNMVVCCSCASGPAFEGAHITHGMRAAHGAIERVQIKDSTIRIKTIDNQLPVGICGSGILDAIAEMLKENIIDRRGSFVVKPPDIKMDNNSNAFILVKAKSSGHGQDIVITRKDINEIQLAKGAIRAGIEILLNEVGVKYDQIDEFIVAGAFGSYISIENAIRIGMFPNLSLNKFRQVGNAAGAGAKQMLINKDRRIFAKKLTQQLKYIELSNHPDFTNQFSKALFFPDF